MINYNTTLKNRIIKVCSVLWGNVPDMRKANSKIICIEYIHNLHILYLHRNKRKRNSKTLTFCSPGCKINVQFLFSSFHFLVSSTIANINMNYFKS